jgi:hypothetical protein
MANTSNSSGISRKKLANTIENKLGLTEDIRCRAYALYESRGRDDGHDLENWLRADRCSRPSKTPRIVSMTVGRRPTPSPAMWRIGLCSNVVEFAFSLLKRGIIHRMPPVRSRGHRPPGGRYSYSIPASSTDGLVAGRADHAHCKGSILMVIRGNCIEPNKLGTPPSAEVNGPNYCHEETAALRPPCDSRSSRAAPGMRPIHRPTQLRQRSCRNGRLDAELR